MISDIYDTLEPRVFQEINCGQARTREGLGPELPRRSWPDSIPPSTQLRGQALIESCQSLGLLAHTRPLHAVSPGRVAFLLPTFCLLSRLPDLKK